MLLTGTIASAACFLVLTLLPALWSEPWMREPLFTDRRENA